MAHSKIKTTDEITRAMALNCLLSLQNHEMPSEAEFMSAFELGYLTITRRGASECDLASRSVASHE